MWWCRFLFLLQMYLQWKQIFFVCCLFYSKVHNTVKYQIRSVTCRLLCVYLHMDEWAYIVPLVLKFYATWWKLIAHLGTLYPNCISATSMVFFFKPLRPPFANMCRVQKFIQDVSIVKWTRNTTAPTPAFLFVPHLYVSRLSHLYTHTHTFTQTHIFILDVTAP